MFERLKKLFGKSAAREAAEPMDMLRKTGTHRALKPTVAARNVAPPKAQVAKAAPAGANHRPIIEGNGPGKNVLVRKRFVREDTGTHETLTILDDSLVISDDESGIDPYNTGQFDRSKSWDKRFLK